MFDTPENLILGLLTGIAFGFFLQKGRVAKFEVILGQLGVCEHLVANKAAPRRHIAAHLGFDGISGLQGG